MSYFERLRRPLIIVSPDFPLDEAIEMRRVHPGRICGAQGSEVKPEAPPPGAEGLAPNKPRALPALPACTESGECAPLALRQAEGSQAKGSAAKGNVPKRREAIASARPDPGRHQRRCRVCSHPDRDAIEEAFIHWHSPTLIAQHYQISDDSLYRHAYATGLDAVRSRNLRCALERILEKAQRVIPTADSIVRAARAYTRINDAGQWVEPPVHVIVSSGSAFPLAESRACLADRRAAAEESSLATRHPALSEANVSPLATEHSIRPSNRGIRELENGSTR